MSARVYQHDLRDIESAIRHFRQVLSDRSRATSRPPSRWRSSSAAPSATPISPIILQRKADILDEPEDKKNALYQAAQIEEDILERHEAAIGVYLKILERDPEDLRSVDALIKLYLGLSRWEDLLDVYTKKADLVADIDEKKRIFYQVGAVYEHELGKVDRAIDTYAARARARSRRSHRARAARRALPDCAELAGAAQRAHARVRALRGSQRVDLVPVPDRRALREAPRRRAARRGALPRDPRRASRRTRPRCRPSKG